MSKKRAVASQKKLNTLTQYPPASVMELWVIAWPLILSALSGNLMLFVDRIMLAQHSISSMNAAATAGMATLIFIFSSVSIAGIAEVFVGRHNGAQQLNRIAEPVWQMLLFSLATALIFWPLAILGSDYIMPSDLREEGGSYFRIIMLGGPLFPMAAALAAFFAGRGQTKIITIAAITGNLINCILDYFLIFGHNGLLPPLGTTGAAIATVLSQLIQVAILASVFFNGYNRDNFQTHICRFIRNTMLQCIKIGYPNALSHLAEMLAWYFLYYSTAEAGPNYITILTLGQSVYIMFAFFADGLQKGVISVASNLLGAQQKNMLNTLLYSAFKLHCCIVGVLMLPLLIFPDLILELFSLGNEGTSQEISALDQYRTCQYVWLYCVFDGFLWVFAGFLTALEDTLFIMFTNAITTALLGVLPLYIMITWFDCPAYFTWAFIDLYALCAMIILALRYRYMMRSKTHPFNQPLLASLYRELQ